ncbi:cryptochrome/photolyase family protein [Photobacterium rosenbergii]|uniref:Cryptochrome/photolyase family protein n=1 Tax=Photobacterium rosenbergii TaxID=294936 RepID=A0ABU3ZCE2_9GAMM|nr:cryptochrome/photolyase family protein [Photobacterium rosenbergii]MDV5167782.1 cryptochrome/photolyase family protein [Photobacterium rosenbergii]
MDKHYKCLRLLLGDQLNNKHSWFQDVDHSTVYVIAELPQEMDYASHHIQKIQAFFLAMQHMADSLTASGHHVLHLTLDETTEYTDLPELLTALITRFQCQRFEYQQPDELRLHQQLDDFCQQLSIATVCVDGEHFIVPFNDLPQYFTRDKNGRLETFYRKLRKKHQILMEDEEKPEGGKWNFDKANRDKLKPNDITELPQPLLFDNDISDINQRLARHKVKSIGVGRDSLLWPVTRKQSLQLLDFFCTHCLPNFGRFQDAMTCQADDLVDQKQWSLYHSRLSFALNSKIISPLEVIECAITHYRSSDVINIAQIEGFVRQILGWREFVRGIYWTHMPEYAQRNHLNASQSLPGWFWNGETKMNCLHHAISQSLEYGYAHHIQRLMVTGNFCMIAGIDPDEVDAWYLGIYVDAIEWVEMPNTRGMSQYADGGIVGSKAYAASGNYINKMSDYCLHCHYQVKEKTSENACPLNSLYWHFMTQHREQFERNPRVGMVYRNWDNQPDENQQAVLDKAKQLLIDIEQL